MIALALVAPGIAHANVGVPMLALAWPLQWIALIPIILLESEILRRGLNIPFSRMVWPVAKANAISTLVGVPIAWIAMLTPLMAISFGYSMIPAGTEVPTYVGYLLFPFTAAWVSGVSAWQVYFAFLILAVPFCWMSIFLEKGIVRRAFQELGEANVYPLIIRANASSYAALCFVSIVFPLAT
jgi:hypothetical protein